MSSAGFKPHGHRGETQLNDEMLNLLNPQKVTDAGLISKLINFNLINFKLFIELYIYIGYIYFNGYIFSTGNRV